MRKARIRRATTVCAVAGILGMLSSACVSSATSQAGARTPASGGASAAAAPGSVTGPTPDAVPGSGLAKGLVLPLEAYMENYSQDAAITRAKQQLEVACMARYGFSYSPPPAAAPPPNYDDANMARRYGISDPDEAATYGYHLPQQSAPPSAVPMSSTEMTVFMGTSDPSSGATPQPKPYDGKTVPVGGCLGESTRKLGATLDTSLSARLNEDSLTQSEAEPQVQSALRAWSSCMKSKGYAVDTPYNAANLAPTSKQPAPDTKELAVAVADVACKTQTDLVGTWYRAESAVQRQQIEQNQSALTALKQKIESAVKNSAAVTGG